MEHACRAVQRPAAAHDAYERCLAARLVSLRADFGRDLSRLSASARGKIDAACSPAQASRGREAYIDCLSGQLASLSASRARAARPCGRRHAVARRKAPSCRRRRRSMTAPQESSLLSVQSGTLVLTALGAVTALGVVAAVVVLRHEGASAPGRCAASAASRCPAGRSVRGVPARSGGGGPARGRRTRRTPAGRRGGAAPAARAGGRTAPGRNCARRKASAFAGSRRSAARRKRHADARKTRVKRKRRRAAGRGAAARRPQRGPTPTNRCSIPTRPRIAARRERRRGACRVRRGEDEVRPRPGRRTSATTPRSISPRSLAPSSARTGCSPAAVAHESGNWIIG